MKKFAKILIVMLVICLTVGVVAVVASASYQAPTEHEKFYNANGGVIPQPFVIGQKGYPTLPAAMNAAKPGDTIHLNKDMNAVSVSASAPTYRITAEENVGNNKVNWRGDQPYETFSGTVGVNVTFDLTIDLNGYKLTAIDAITSSLFYVTSGTLTVTGPGEIANVKTAFNVQGENSKLVIDALGEGIKISNAGTAKYGFAFPLFVIENGASADLTGYVEIQPSHMSTMIFRLMGPTYNKIDGAKEVNFDSAKVVVNPPTTTGADPRGNDLNTVFYMKDGTTVNIKNGSHIETDARMFWMPTQTSYGVLDITSYMEQNGVPKADADFSTLAIAPATVHVNVDNSSVIVNGNPAAPDSNNGALFQIGDIKLGATFNNSYIMAGSRVLIGSTNGASNKVDVKQIEQNSFIFNNCTFERAKTYNSTSSVFVNGGINLKWTGGTFDNYDNYNNRYHHAIANAYQYQELGTGFFGVLFEDCAFNADLPIVPASADGKNWSYLFSTSEAVHKDPLIIEGNEAKAYKYYFGEGVFPSAKYAVTGNGVALDYKYNATDGKSGTSIFAGALSMYALPGVIEEITDENGNGYLRHTFDETHTSGSSYMQINSGGSANSWDKYNLYVAEFDIAAVNGSFPSKWSGVPFTYQGRITNPRYDAEGTFLGDESLYSPGGVPKLHIKANGDIYFDSTDTGFDAPTDGSWTRISYVIEADISDEIESRPVQAYVKNSEGKYVADGEKLTPNSIELRKVTAYLHYYVNGQHIGTFDIMPESYGYGGYVAVGYESKLHDAGLRIQPLSAPGTGYCLDNIRVSMYPVSDNVDLGIKADDGTVAESIVGNPHFLIMPENGKAGVVGNVDGVDYATEEELAAAIKDGSVVTLKSDYQGLLPVPGAMLLKTEGHALKGFTSQTHKPVDYSGMSAYKFIPASADEILIVDFAADDFGISKTVNAVIGSHYPVYDADVVSSDNRPFDGFYHKLLGWNDANGNLIVEAEDAENGVVTLLPIYENTPYYFTIEAVGGEILYFDNQEDLGAISAALNAFIKANEGKTVRLVLWGSGELEAPVNVPCGTSLYVDINGNDAGVASDGFIGTSGASLYIYSSMEGGELFANNVLVTGSYDASAASGFETVIGTVSDDTLGINANGANLFVVAGKIYEYSADAADVYNNVASLTIDGGLYSAEDPNAAAFIEVKGGDADIEIKNLAIAVCTPIVGGHGNYSFDNAYVLRFSMETADVSSESLINELAEGASVTFTNSSLAGGISKVDGTVTLGAKCSLASPEAVLENVTLGEGVVAAFANYEVTVEGIEYPVYAYTDTPENLTHITWYDSDGTVLGETYNALDGVIVDGMDYASEVKIAVGTEWYEVRFTKWNLPESHTAGELSIYPICDTPVADVKCLLANLTAYTYFKINYYLPAEVAIEGFELIGISSDALGENLIPAEMVTIDGVDYFKYTEVPAASDVSINTRYVHFIVDGYKYVYDFEFGIPKYAETAMANAELSELEHKLIMNMVRYSNESYKLANGITEGLEAYEKLLAANSDLLLDYTAIEESTAFKNNAVSDTTALAKHMSGATFMFGSAQPRFVFLYKGIENIVLPTDADGSIGAWPKDNRGVFTHFYYETALGGSSSHLAYHIGVDGATANALANGAWTEGDEIYAMTGDVSVCDIIQPIYLAVYDTDGQVVRGHYSLATYITNLEANGNGAYYDIAMSLYAFALTAGEYGTNTVLK